MMPVGFLKASIDDNLLAVEEGLSDGLLVRVHAETSQQYFDTNAVDEPF
jgi:hypothetical protein